MNAKVLAAVPWGAVLAVAGAFVTLGGAAWRFEAVEDATAAIERRLDAHDALAAHPIQYHRTADLVGRVATLEREQAEIEDEVREGLEALRLQVAAICAATNARCP